MKSFLLALSAVFALASCSKTSQPSNGPFPIPPPRDSRYPDQSRVPETRYPSPNPSGDNSTTYPAEGQRDGVVTIIRSGDNNYENLPPGQAKKKYGSKSAKVYAPGQRKKNGGQYGNGIPTVISVPDQYAGRSTSGQLYYNYRGHTYWKQNDGYYHLSEDRTSNKQKSKAKGKGKNKGYDDDDD